MRPSIPPRWQSRWRSHFPIGSPAAATRPAKAGNPPAAAASGSTPYLRSRGPNGSRSARWRGARRARGSCRAAPLSSEAVTELFGDRIEVRHEADFDPSTRSVTPTRTRRLGAIRLASGPDPNPDQAAIEQAMLNGVREHGLDMLPWDDRSTQLRDRAAFARRFTSDIPSLEDAALVEGIEEWLSPLLAGKRRLTDVPGAALASALDQLLDFNQRRELDRLIPSEFKARPELVTASIIRRRRARRSKCAPRLCSASRRTRPLQTGRCRSFLPSPRLRAGQSRPPGTCLPSGQEAGARSRRKCAAAIPKHPWPDDPAGASPTLRTKRSSASQP